MMPARIPFAILALALALPAGPLPSPALLVVSREGSLAIVDPAARQVVGRVRTGEGPREVAVSSDGRLAFVSNYGSPEALGRAISVIDLAAETEIRRIDLSPLSRPLGLAFAAGKLYFAAEADKIIGAIDPAAGRVDWLLGTGQNATRTIWASPDASRIVVANRDSNSIGIFDRTGVADWNQTVIAVGKGPEGFDVSPDGAQLWVANSRDGTVSAVDLVSKRLIRTFGVQTSRSSRLKFTPDGRLALISDAEAGDLLIFERATRKELKRIPLGHEPSAILITPDGARAYISVTDDNDVASIDLRTFDLAARIAAGNAPDGLAWVPALSGGPRR
jgi:DNA-binding beta-propeller fold protein YncE